MTFTKALFALFLFFLLTTSANAQVVEQKLIWEPKKIQTAMTKQGVVKQTPLSNQRKFEQDKKWQECAQAGSRNFKSTPLVRGWVGISWLKCARENAAEKRVSQGLITAVKQVTAQSSLFLAGPWRSALQDEVIKSRVLLLDLLPKTNPKGAWEQVDALLLVRDQLERSQKALAYQVAGELAQQRAQLFAAKSFYESSLKELESSSTRDKLNSVLFALNEDRKTEEASVSPLALSAEEIRFEERFDSADKNGDLVALAEDAIVYLRQFPNGRRAKWAQDKVIEIYLNFFDQSGGERMAALRGKILNVMEKADALRQVEWARNLHRRADFIGGLRLAEKSLETLSSSSSAAVLYFIAGRSSQFLGDYKKAQKYFEKYVETSSGAEDYPEVLFRLALTHIRQDQDSSAVATIEKLLVQKNIDRYELSARYWLVRALQETKNPRAAEEINLILERYPFSYYGLRLRLEKMKGLLDWPTTVAVGVSPKGSYYLTPGQKNIWDRVQLLSQQGWSAEALKEVLEMPVPENPQVKVLLAQKWAEAGAFPVAIRLINEAGDLDPNLRAMDVVGLSLPLNFQDAIDGQARKQGLAPVLVRSLIRQESAFGLRATSTSNALGLMQLIPPTATEVASELGLSKISIPEDLFVPDINIQMGTYYISKMIKQFGGNVPMGLAAYNAGPTRMQIFVKARPEVDRLKKTPSSEPWDELWMDEVPWFETSFYVKAILRNTMMYKVLERSGEKNPDLRRVQYGPVLWKDLVLQ